MAREPSHPFKNPTAEAVRLVIARALAQRIPADSVVHELYRLDLLPESVESLEKDQEVWR